MKLAHIDTWIFDLDNTLYPAACDLFAQIDARMTGFIARLLTIDRVAARAVQKDFFHSHGMTLRGLIDAHGVDPHDFLAEVHDIDLGVVAHDARLVAALAALPGRSFVLTNADLPYAARVLDRLGLAGQFEAVHDIHAMGLRPKPELAAYRGFCDAHGVEPRRALFVEDMARNLVPAKALGMTTVWVDNGSEQGPGAAREHIDIVIGDVGEWLATVVEELEAA